MNELWKKQKYPITFQLCTASKFDRIELYGSFTSLGWKKPIAQLTYAYQKAPEEFIYSEVVQLIPGNYEYKYKINDQNWIINQNERKIKDNNSLTKEDFVQLIIDRSNFQEKKNVDDQIRYHDAAMLLYTTHLLSDIELVVNNEQHYKAHRAILSAGSDFFKAMFESNMTESTSKTISLKLDDVSSFPAVLKFLYVGSLEANYLNFDQIESLLKLADMYQIPTLFKALLDLTTKEIDANNCLHLLFMEKYLGDDWPTVRKQCIQIAAKHFLYICHQEEFSGLPFNALSDILDHKDIIICNQAMLYVALHRWAINSSKGNDSDCKIDKYMVPDLYHDAIKKCTEFYKNPATIVCFFADGTERYTTMTINAMNSFLNFTPYVMVGLLVMNNETKKLVLEKIDRKHHYRIICKQTSKSPIIKDWNPTQYKLDIIKYSYDGFQEIYWMDSDTAVYRDMTASLSAFRLSTHVFYFTLDHVMYDQNFLNKWQEQHQQTFIPQACFMGFKSIAITSFFDLWKQAWNTWTQPQPFSVYKDPNPSFPGSAFCIEQYALGNAVHSYITKQASTVNSLLIAQYINVIPRNLIFIPQTQQQQITNESLKLRSMIGRQPCTSSVPRCVPYVYSISRYTSSYLAIVKNPMVSVNQCNGAVFIDDFLDCFVHFYNENYDEGYQWYLKNMASS
ncbi:unnamed protein product [Adineta steineri]|uniref:BTB domain-containing protein n=1 Tax=Adineta steineri TaxID=433720 RepID=A0A813QTU7_9BILA|nr:unnamed protein product [Adineta steineri]CAF3558456.1 unnamed protein product [Adineta steineri]